MKKILIIDDNENLLEITQHILSDAGFEIDTMENIQDALQIINTIQYDLVIIDYMMPFMNGLEASKWIRKKLPNIKILIISGYTDWEIFKQDVKKVSEVPILPKPFKGTKLLATVKDLLGVSHET